MRPVYHLIYAICDRLIIRLIKLKYLKTRNPLCYFKLKILYFSTPLGTEKNYLMLKSSAIKSCLDMNIFSRLIDQLHLVNCSDPFVQIPFSIMPHNKFPSNQIINQAFILNDLIYIIINVILF